MHPSLPERPSSAPLLVPRTTRQKVDPGRRERADDRERVESYLTKEVSKRRASRRLGELSVRDSPTSSREGGGSGTYPPRVGRSYSVDGDGTAPGGSQGRFRSSYLPQCIRWSPLSLHGVCLSGLGTPPTSRSRPPSEKVRPDVLDSGRQFPSRLPPTSTRRVSTKPTSLADPTAGCLGRRDLRYLSPVRGGRGMDGRLRISPSGRGVGRGRE